MPSHEPSHETQKNSAKGAVRSLFDVLGSAVQRPNSDSRKNRLRAYGSLTGVCTSLFDPTKTDQKRVVLPNPLEGSVTVVERASAANEKFLVSVIRSVDRGYETGELEERHIVITPTSGTIMEGTTYATPGENPDRPKMHTTGNPRTLDSVTAQNAERWLTEQQALNAPIEAIIYPGSRPNPDDFTHLGELTLGTYEMPEGPKPSAN